MLLPSSISQRAAAAAKPNRQPEALHYLNGKKVSINETAYLVGFSDPAAFSRAFTRWTGSSPRIYNRIED
jgi:AraC-like DNA-binding protein